MVFKRRDRRPPLRAMWEMLFPPGGWGRAFRYVKYRLRRLPDTPERISRGIWAGVFVSFSPLFGLHFVLAAVLARIMKGNLIAALMGTFFGNPLTYVPIGLISLETGSWLLGKDTDLKSGEAFAAKFVDAWADMKLNFMAMFTDQTPDWHGLSVFFDDVLLPYMIGGLIPGVLAATVCYIVALPIIRAYQKGRKRKIKAKFDAIKRKAVEKPERGSHHVGAKATASGRQH